MIALIVGIFYILGILSAVRAVMSTRTPQGAIAWSVSLVTFPYIAVPAYWILGRNKFQGYVIARQQELERIASVSQQAENELSEIAAIVDAQRANVLGAERLARLPATRGNRVELLVDGEATFSSILDGIGVAEQYVLVQFYIVHDDGIGRELKAKLIAKAKEGVQIHFLYDEIGSADLPESYLDELRKAGVEIFPFNTRKGKGNHFQINFRNHRKIVVVDGRVAWVGGHNVGDEYLGKDPKIGHWRDTHVRIEGPAAIAVQLSFAEDWHWATDTVPADLSWDPYMPDEGQTQALIIPSGPADELETAALVYTLALNSAQKRIWIASPYFVPDEAIIAALQLAALRGLDVRILIPDKSDNLMVDLAVYSFFDIVSETGVKFYRYTDGFLHAKSALIDDTVATIGTANFDNRSMRLNFEITAILIDPDFIPDVEKMYENDFANARLMQSGEYDEKPYWFRFLARVFRLASPVL